ncbi:hypothetical protein DFH06DRAFT_1055659 [Mycena polygramma]|nr:hypothetical protein DFH06DRAFT_1055659 [Mycena polygramma]
MELTEECTRVHDLWFSDGSLVIKAGTKMFRVSKAQLAARSTVFEAMVAAGPPENSQDELIEGSPVVVLHDSGEDVEAFLRAIFDSSFFMPPPEPVYLTDTLAILRLSHKYDVGYLHRRALQHLSRRFYFASQKEFEARVNHFKQPPGYETTTPRAFALISAAQEVGALWLLPLAYYSACTRLKFDQLLTAADNGADEIQGRTCLVGCHFLAQALFRVHGFLAHPADNCLNPNHCHALRCSWWSALVTNISSPHDVTPLHFWEKIWGTAPSDSKIKLCVHCYTTARDEYQREVERCWDALPSYFGLPGWPELHAMKEAAMASSTS